MTSATKLPEKVIQLLQNGKFVHLGTASKEAIPEVSLMNYYYLPSNELYRKEDGTNPYIILATGKSSLKYQNISQNPNVSLLFHDWTTAKTLYNTDPSSNLLNLLQSLNHTELSQVSATLKGSAKIVDDSSELTYYKELLKKENPDAKCYIDGDENAIILVTVTNTKVCDSENHISSYN